MPEPPKPTRAHRAAIAELGLRFQPANGADLEAYALRLELLAKDCAHLAVPLLRAACDRSARDAKGLPYASVIVANATAIVEERQRMARESREPHARPASGDDLKAERAREHNRRYMAEGARHRVTANFDIFRIGDPGERRATRDDGSVIEPMFSHEKHEWFVDRGDARALDAAYRAHGAKFVMRGNVIVRVEA